MRSTRTSESIVHAVLGSSWIFDPPAGRRWPGEATVSTGATCSASCLTARDRFAKSSCPRSFSSLGPSSRAPALGARSVSVPVSGVLIHYGGSSEPVRAPMASLIHSVRRGGSSSGRSLVGSARRRWCGKGAHLVACLKNLSKSPAIVFVPRSMGLGRCRQRCRAAEWSRPQPHEVPCASPTRFG